MRIAAPTATELMAPGAAQAWKSAQEFEAMALGELLQPMFDTVQQAQAPFGGGEAEGSWRPMLTQELAKQMAKAGGLGLAEPIYRQIMLLQQQQQAPPDTATLESPSK